VKNFLLIKSEVSRLHNESLLTFGGAFSGHSVVSEEGGNGTQIHTGCLRQRTMGLDADAALLLDCHSVYLQHYCNGRLSSTTP